MTDTSVFVPGESRQAEPDSDVEEASSSPSRAVLIAGGVGVVLALGIGGYLLLGGGGDEPQTAAVPTHTRSSVAPSATPSPVAPKPAAKTSHVFRDPFKPLLSVAVPTGGTGTSTDVPTSASTQVPTGTTTQVPTGTATNVPKTTPKPAKPVVKFKVISVAADNTSGKVSVNGKASTAALGGPAFATFFKVLRYTEGTCGTFQYGDERFDLCEGKTATMQ